MIILLYHDIDTPDDPTWHEDHATRETVVRFTEFEGHMAYLADQGYRVITISQYLKNKGAFENSSAQKTIVLSFDDGHISNYRYAYSVLNKYAFKATFFIIADKVGAPNFMGAAEIRALFESDMEIGSHGKTHAYLPNLDSDTLQFEIGLSKLVLERLLGVEVVTFAYPGGHYDADIVKYVRRAGYRAAASCILGANRFDTNPFLLRRLEIRRGTSRIAFSKALNQRHMILHQGVDKAKSLLKQAVGLENYSSLRQRLYRFYPFKR